MTASLLTYRGTVHQWQCDHMGHMNVMWYVGKFDEATWNLAAMMGMTAQYLKDAKRGMAAVDQRIAYRREALPGDVVTIRTAIIEVRPKSVRFAHEMRRGYLGDLLATMVVTGVHIDVVARKSGFGGEDRLRRAFHRAFGMSPRDYHHQAAGVDERR